MEVSKKDYYFLLGFNLSEKYQLDLDKSIIKDEIAGNVSLAYTWTEYDPHMLYSYLRKTEDVPGEFYDDFIRGVELSQERTLFHAYLELEGVK